MANGESLMGSLVLIPVQILELFTSVRDTDRKRSIDVISLE